MFLSFAHLPVIMHKIIQRYFHSKPSHELTKNRCLELLLKIILEYYSRLNLDDRELFYCFVNTLPTKWQLEFRDTIENAEKKRKLGLVVPSCYAKLGTEHSKPPFDLFKEFTPLEVAEALCLIELKGFKTLRAQEFQREAWTKIPADSPNIRNMIKRFNCVCNFVTTNVVLQEKVKNRARIYKFFVAVASHLATFNNYQTMYAILSGLNDGPVERLKHTQAEVGPQDIATYESLQALMAADKSYASYRAALANAKPPVIPYIGVYLRDCTYFGDGLKSDDGTSFNPKKLNYLWNVIAQVKTFSSADYTFKSNDRLEPILEACPSISNDQMWKLSKEREPKGVLRADIQ